MTMDETAGSFRLQVGAGEIAVNIADRPSLMAAVRARLEARNGFALATLNLDHLVKLRTDARFHTAYQAQDLVVADGNPVVWLSRLAGRPVNLMPGSDLVLPLARLAADLGRPIALLGATEAVLAAAAAHLETAVPGLRVATRLAPGQGFDADGAEADALLSALGQSEACLTFLALGAPRQEILAARGRDALPGMGFVSIGAGLDFLAGTQNRAPHWVRAIAMEWFWRMALSPARLGRRYLNCALILPGLALRILARRRKV